jgi:DNA mismatch repair protein MSH3
MTTPKASQGKRKSGSQPSLISNYFKRIDSPVTSKTPSRHDNDANGTPSKPRRAAESVIIAASDEEHEVDDVERTSKRPRLATPPESVESSRPVTPPGASERNALTALMSPKIKEFRPPPQSPRTARYKYTGAGGANAEEQSTPEQIVKKKTLHEKFVAKLGRPESMALLRKNSASGREDEEGEEGEGEEEEEEIIPAAKSLRGKYASTAASGKKAAPASKKGTATSTTKFTPLEKQYVEIKKKYPDTLLLIEVGYKFRFFGEDAKVLRCSTSVLIRDCLQGTRNSPFHEP